MSGGIRSCIELANLFVKHTDDRMKLSMIEPEMIALSRGFDLCMSDQARSMSIPARD
jgi:hypothetical protein